MAASHQDALEISRENPNVFFQFSSTVKSSDNLNHHEKEEFLELLKELLIGYERYIQNISVEEVTLTNGVKINLLPEKLPRSKNDVLNNPSLIEQLLPIYVSDSDWQNHPQHDWLAGRIRNLDFFKNIFGRTEAEVKQNLVYLPWMPNSFKEKTLPITTILDVSDHFLALSKELETLSPDVKQLYLEKPSGTFNWRPIAGTNRLSAHSFGMTFDLTVNNCEYWLWDYKDKNSLSRQTPLLEDDIPDEDIPTWRHTAVPFEIVSIFEKHGWMWGGKWRNYDTMHFEYRPECFARTEIKLRLRELLEKMGFQLLPPLHYAPLARVQLGMWTN